MDSEATSLLSAGFPPSAVRQLREVIQKLNNIEVENSRLAAENTLLKQQLILTRDNAGLKVANVLGQVISWFDDKTQTTTVNNATFMTPNIAIREGSGSTSDMMSTMNTRDLFSSNNSPLTLSALAENSSKRSRSPSIAMLTQDLKSTTDKENETIAWSQDSLDNIQVETSADSGNQTIISSHQSSSPPHGLPAGGTPISRPEPPIDVEKVAELPTPRTPHKRIRPLEISRSRCLHHSSQDTPEDHEKSSSDSDFEDNFCTDVSDSDLDENPHNLMQQSVSKRHLVVVGDFDKSRGYVWVRNQNNLSNNNDRSAQMGLPKLNKHNIGSPVATSTPLNTIAVPLPPALNMDSTIERSRSKDTNTFQIPQIIISRNEPKSLRFSTPEAETLDNLQAVPARSKSPSAESPGSQLDSAESKSPTSGSNSQTISSKSPIANSQGNAVNPKPRPESPISPKPHTLNVSSLRSTQLASRNPSTDAPDLSSKAPAIQDEVTTGYLDSLSPSRFISPRHHHSYRSETPGSLRPSMLSESPTPLRPMSPTYVQTKPSLTDSPSIYYDSLSHLESSKSDLLSPRSASPRADRLMSSPTKFSYSPRSPSSPTAQTVSELPGPVGAQSVAGEENKMSTKADIQKPPPASFQKFWNSVEPDRTQKGEMFVPSLRLVGELAFQLDRRILNYVFNSVRHSGNRTRFYGYLVKNIPEMITKQVSGPDGHIQDVALASILNYRYKYVMYSLKPLGYDANYHADLCVDLVNKYGLLPVRSENSLLKTMRTENSEELRYMLIQITPSDELKQVLLLLDCLIALAKDDKKPLFVW